MRKCNGVRCWIFGRFATPQMKPGNVLPGQVVPVNVKLLFWFDWSAAGESWRQSTPNLMWCAPLTQLTESVTLIWSLP